MKEITENDALYRLAALCSKSEHCSHEMVEKMVKWGLDEEAQARVMSRLTTEKYIDDVRYCRFFIRDKVRYNHWGRAKIEQALWLKRIPKSISSPIFDEMDEKEYTQVLRKLLDAKRKTITAKNDFEAKGKLIKFALGIGFSMEVIRKCLDTDGYNMEDEDNDKFLE